MPRLGLQTKLIVGVLLVLAPLLWLLLYSLHLDMVQRRAGVLDDMTQTAQTVALLADATFDEAVAAGWAMAGNPAVQSLDTATMVPYLRELSQRYPRYSNIFVADAQGVVRGRSLDLPLGVPPRIADRGYFQRVMASGQPTTEEMVLSRATGRPTSGVAVPIVGPDGQRLGMVGVSLEPKDLAAQLTSLAPASSQSITLVDPTGWLAFSTSRQELPWEERDLSARPEVQAALSGQTVREAQFASPPLPGDHAAVFVSTPRYGWVVGVTWSTAEAFGPAEQRFRLGLLLFGALTLVLLAGATLLSRYLVTPLEHLGLQAQALARGEMNRRVSIKTGDELEAVGQAFNVMAEELHQTLRHLREARDEAANSADLAREANQRLVLATSRAQEAAHEAETERARLRAILQSTTHGIVFIDAQSNRLLANPAAEQLLGRPLTSGAGRQQFVGIVCDPHGQPRTVEELVSSRALHGRSVHGEEELIVRPDGRRIPVLASASPVRDDEGKMTAAFVLPTVSPVAASYA